MAKYTPIGLGEVIEKQNLQQVNLTVPIYDKAYEFKTSQGVFRIVLTRCYNFSNEKLFDGNHLLWFDYSKLGKRFRKTARRIESVLEEDPLLCESAESLLWFAVKHGPTLKGHIQAVCPPAEAKHFDRLVSDLETLVKEDKFSVDSPFEAVLVNNCPAPRVQDTANRLDQEIKERLLSSNNEYSCVGPDEIERLNRIFEDIAINGGFDIKTSSVEDTLLFYFKTITKHFEMHGGDRYHYDEEKNRLGPSAILSNPDEIEVSCAPPAFYLTRMINYASAVNPNFKHIHALATGTVDFEKERGMMDYCHHAIVGVVDTENRRISFLDPFLLLVPFPFYPPNTYSGLRVTTSYRNELIGYLPGAITSDGRSGLNLRQFLEESRRNLKRSY